MFTRDQYNYLMHCLMVQEREELEELERSKFTLQRFDYEDKSILPVAAQHIYRSNYEKRIKHYEEQLKMNKDLQDILKGFYSYALV